MTDGAQTNRAAPVLERIGLVLALAAPLVRATVLVSPFPGWDLDPFTFPSPPSGLGPTGSMLCDALASLGVVLVLIGRWLGGVALPVVPAALFGVGAIGVLIHTVFSGANATVAETWIGSSWLTAMLLGLCLATTPAGERGDRVRAIAGTVFLGFVALLAVRGAQQVFIEHPQTLADFRRNREAIFAAQGWSPESPMAKAYERRLVQPEATGWFGLANVYATFAAAGTVMALTLVIAAARAYLRGERAERPIGGVIGAGVALAAGVTALYFAGGKGGYMAAALGTVAVLALSALGTTRARTRLGERASLVGGLVGTGALAVALVLVVARGVAGDRLGELSLLFRWFYMQAAARIGVAHLPIGVGPDGFQQAYMLAKNPLSPEDVTSSHNLLLDWFATLGVFGLAWAALWVWWIWRAGRGAAAPSSAETPASKEFVVDDAPKHDRWTVAAIGTIAVFVGVRLDQHVLTPDMAVVRLVGLVAFCAVAWAALAAFRRDARAMRLALAGGAIAAGAHALIDVTGVWPASAALLFVLAGAAARRGPREVATTRSRATLAGVSGAVLLTAVTTFSLLHVNAWESVLRRSAAYASEAGAVNQRWQAIVDAMQARRAGATDEARALALELGVRDVTPAAVEAAVRAHDLKATRAAWTMLAKKAESDENEWKTRREASRVGLRLAGLLRLLGEEAEAAKAEEIAERLMADALPRWNQTPSELAWLALVRESLAERPGGQGWLPKAAEALEQAATLAPYELEYALRLMRIYERAGDSAGARRWASKALQLDSGLKYDREVKGMSQRDREEATRLAGLS